MTSFFASSPLGAFSRRFIYVPLPALLGVPSLPFRGMRPCNKYRVIYLAGSNKNWTAHRYCTVLLLIDQENATYFVGPS